MVFFSNWKQENSQKYDKICILECIIEKDMTWYFSTNPPLDTVTLIYDTDRNEWAVISILLLCYRVLALAGTAILRVQHLFPSGFPTKIMYAYASVTSFMRPK
jgi:hypothetical protein